eukprot:scaffold107644_cov33-Prasinocladus_malaysianus.AAC.1
MYSHIFTDLHRYTGIAYMPTHRYVALWSKHFVQRMCSSLGRLQRLQAHSMRRRRQRRQFCGGRQASGRGRARGTPLLLRGRGLRGGRV